MGREGGGGVKINRKGKRRERGRGKRERHFISGKHTNRFSSYKISSQDDTFPSAGLCGYERRGGS